MQKGKHSAKIHTKATPPGDFSAYPAVRNASEARFTPSGSWINSNPQRKRETPGTGDHHSIRPVR
jgi:hypothetical protein